MQALTKELVLSMKQEGIVFPRNESFWQLLYNFLCNPRWYPTLEGKERRTLWDQASTLLKSGKAMFKGEEVTVLDVYPRSPDYRVNGDYILVYIQGANGRSFTLGLSEVSYKGK